MNLIPKWRTKAVWKLVSIVILLSIVIIVFIVTNSQPEDPLHEGKRISQWLSELALEKDRTTGSSASAALKRAGHRAAPRLIHELRTKDSSIGGALRKYVPAWAQSRVAGPANRSFFRADCASILGDIFPISPEIIRALVDAVEVDVEPVNYSSAMAIRRIAGRDEQAARELRQRCPEILAIRETGLSEHLAVMRVVRAINKSSTNEAVRHANSEAR